MLSSIKYRNKYLADWCEKCFIDSKAYFWYYFIPKNASSSLRNVEYKGGGYFFDHNPREARSHLYTLQKGKTEKIVVLREPFARLVSAYCYDKREDVFNDSVSSYMEHIANGYPSFESVPQTAYLESRKVNLETMDYVWLVETLEKQFNEFCIKNDLDLVLPAINVSTPEERKMVEEEMRWPHNYKIFCNEYAKDIEMYNTWRRKING